MNRPTNTPARKNNTPTWAAWLIVISIIGIAYAIGQSNLNNNPAPDKPQAVVVTNTPVPTIDPTVAPTATPIPTATPTPIPTATTAPTATPEPSPTALPTATPKVNPTPTAIPANLANSVNNQNCVIKGNISASGEKIYHLPGQRYYNATLINTSKGERWFCTEEEAIAAGWRKSKV